MEGATSTVRRSTRVSARRRPKTTVQEPARKKRVAGQRRQENMLALSVRQPPVKMQEVSVGIQRLPRPLETAKENHGLVRVAVKTRPIHTAGQSDDMMCAQPSASEPMEVTPPVPEGGEEDSSAPPGGPLPQLSWANSRDLWTEMRDKDVSKMAPEEEIQSRHPDILPSMRTILLDWLMEVCEEYKLHRETYYLAVDLHDRFLDSWRAIRKEHLQAIGITCLFIASKIEEIYPPKVSEFAFVTDGACTVSDILEMELLVCKALNWKLNHHMVTVNTWVNTYMQVSSHHLRPPGITKREFEYPAYSPLEFIRVLQLLDMCTLDLSSRTFTTSILAASALYLASERSRQHFTAITGLSLDNIDDCVHWMYPFALVISKETPIAQRPFPGVIPQDAHNIQTHAVTIPMLDDALELRHSRNAATALSNDVSLSSTCSLLHTPSRHDGHCLSPINASSSY